MTCKKLGKVLFVWLCIITLIMPVASNVLAFSYDEVGDTPMAISEVTALTKSSTTANLESIQYREGGNESTGLEDEEYDTNKYAYTVGGVSVLKVVQKDDYDYSDTFYCLNAEKSLSIQSNYQYRKAASDLTDMENVEVSKWKQSLGISDENFNSLMYLLNNIYVKKLNPSYKDTYLSAAFAQKIIEDQNKEPKTTLEMIKKNLTDDDIEVVQQWAVWYFTNSKAAEPDVENEERVDTYNQLTSMQTELILTDTGAQDIKPLRLQYAQILYNYLIETAKEAGQTGHKANLNRTNRNLSLWLGEKDETNLLEPENLQPLVLILEDEEVYDLALRKFIVSVNGNTPEGGSRAPVPSNLEALADGTVETADYKHKKSPVSVEKGDRVVFEFRVYNEGNVDAYVQEIVDYLPEGLEIVDSSESTINQRVIWHVEENGRKLVTKSLSDLVINKFNTEDRDNLVLDYESIQLECEVVGDNVAQGSTLTNLAEITLDDGDDRDSHEVVGPVDSDWAGNSNQEDLSQSDYYYKGKEDDDDFEKVVLGGFDLSLKKFISSKNGKKENREPVVDVTPLNNGRYDANYSVSKNAVTVATGDIVTFTLRVYNEGDFDGYADEIIDYIPEGLGFLPLYNDNIENRWSLVGSDTPMTLSEIKNGTKNLSLSDFSDTETLEEAVVIPGRSKISTDALKYSEGSTKNLIEKFDGTTLKYKDVEATFIVIAEDEFTLKNIAAITSEKDSDGNDVVQDRDSKPLDDINPDSYTTGNEDDDDYDVVTNRNFDLALQKFITGLNDSEVTDREPAVSLSNGEIKYTHKNSEPLRVGNGDLVEYTIRVYNEGNIDGYAEEVKDNVPNGLVFVPENETNQKYGWKMYDQNGRETTDPSQAVTVRTDFLSKEKSEENIIEKFNGTELKYQDVKLVFRVDEKAIQRTVTSSERTLTNIAEISKATDKDGNEIPDIDSTPDNDNPSEDDTDRENVYVKYFDLALEKTLSKAIVTTDGQRKEVAGSDNLKIEINRKKLNSTSIQFVYIIKVTNQGEIEGFATEITDTIPQGLTFNNANNPDWTLVSEGVIRTEGLAQTLLQPGESAEIEVVLDWNRSSENLGKFVNIAEITEDWNPYDSHDVDSTPNNNVPAEDDQDDSPVWVGVITGLGDQPYIVLTTAVLVILASGLALIKKYVL